MFFIFILTYHKQLLSRRSFRHNALDPRRSKIRNRESHFRRSFLLSSNPSRNHPGYLGIFFNIQKKSVKFWQNRMFSFYLFESRLHRGEYRILWRKNQSKKNGQLRHMNRSFDTNNINESQSPRFQDNFP